VVLLGTYWTHGNLGTHWEPLKTFENMVGTPKSQSEQKFGIWYINEQGESLSIKLKLATIKKVTSNMFSQTCGCNITFRVCHANV